MIAFVGGIGLGILQAELAGFLPDRQHPGHRPAPVAAVRGAVRARGAPAPVVADEPATSPTRWPASTRHPPPPAVVAAPAVDDDDRPRVFGVGAALIGSGLCLFVLDDFWLSLVTGGVGLAVILLSIVLTTGVGGTISLCQATFAAIGAFTTAQLVRTTACRCCSPWWSGALIAAAVRRGAEPARSSAWPASTPRSPRWRSR